MATDVKLPYYQRDDDFFSTLWIRFEGRKGCVPLDPQISISIDRKPPPLPGEKEPKLTREEKKQQQAEAERQQLQAKLNKKAQVSTKEPWWDECDNPPPFDLLDIPDAMDKMKFPVAVKLMREWFSGHKYIYDDKPDAIQPYVDTETVTLKWLLKYKDVKKRYKELIDERVLSENAIKKIKEKMSKFISQRFSTYQSVPSRLDTMKIAETDMQRLHGDFQFQFIDVSGLKTLDGMSAIDLTAALGNFNFYAAIASAEISGTVNERDAFCFTPSVKVTHFYVYAKDDYSFNDKGKSSQYLGHWNKNGVIVVPLVAAADAISNINHEKLRKTNIDIDYRIIGIDTDYPVDKRSGWFGKNQPKNIYFPVRNRHFREWREKHNRGRDFMIYSDVERVKLSKPIEFTLESICRPYETK